MYAGSDTGVSDFKTEEHSHRSGTGHDLEEVDLDNESDQEQESYYDHEHDQLHTPGGPSQPLHDHGHAPPTPGDREASDNDIEIVHEDLEFDPMPHLNFRSRSQIAAAATSTSATITNILPVTFTQSAVIPESVPLEPGSAQSVSFDNQNLSGILLALTGGSVSTGATTVNRHSFSSFSIKNPNNTAIISQASQFSSSIVTVTDTGTLQIPRYIFLQPTCRICLRETTEMVYLFEDHANNRTGLKFTRGPAAKKFNLLQAIKTLLDLEPQYGDGLPDHICLNCHDSIMTFSTFRKQIDIGQCKLKEIMKQVENSANQCPTVIPQIGESDLTNTQIYKYSDKILKAKGMIQRSEFNYLAKRFLPNSVWDKMFMTFGGMLGIKSNKLNGLFTYVIEQPFVESWFCDPCRKIIHGGKAAYLEHFSTTHQMNPEDVPFPCDICGQPFLEMDSSGIAENYCEHWLQHFFFHDCESCGKNLPGLQALALHKEVNHQQGKSATGEAYLCGDCGKVFKKRDYLRAHMKTHGGSQGKNASSFKPCHICGKELKSSLKDHINSVHSDSRKWKCEICSSTYKTKEALSVHRASVHAARKVESDSITVAGRDRDREFRCNRCYEKCQSHAELSLHILRHNGTTKACNLCAQKFSTPEALTHHKEKSHKKNLRYNCTTCGKFFRRKEYLIIHSRIHTNELPHECNICGKKIRMKSNYLKHLRVHDKQQKKIEVVPLTE